MKHDHTECAHEIAYCAKCDACWCAKCEKEWGNKASWTPPYWAPRVKGLGVRDPLPWERVFVTSDSTATPEQQREWQRQQSTIRRTPDTVGATTCKHG